MDLKVIFGFCFVLLYCSLIVDAKAVNKSEEKKAEPNTSLKEKADKEVKGSESDDDDVPIDIQPGKLKKCNIICEKNKTIEKRCNCKEEKCKDECAEKRQTKCDVKKCQQPSHGHGVEKRCRSAAGKKKSCCITKKTSPLKQRLFKLPASMIAPIRSYNEPENKECPDKRSGNRCTCEECCHCPCCCCCCCEPCCCCDCCHHCCCCDCCHHCCHCCPCCCCCCKKSKAAGAPARPKGN